MSKKTYFRSDFSWLSWPQIITDLHDLYIKWKVSFSLFCGQESHIKSDQNSFFYVVNDKFIATLSFRWSLIYPSWLRNQSWIGMLRRFRPSNCENWPNTRPKAECSVSFHSYKVWTKTKHNNEWLVPILTQRKFNI